MLLNGGHHPVDLGVAFDSLVGDVDENDLEVLIRGVGADPVRVQHAESLEGAADALLGDGLKVPFGFLLLHGTRSLGFTVRAALGDGTFPASATHGDTVDDIALLVLVAEPPGLVGSG